MLYLIQFPMHRAQIKPDYSAGCADNTRGWENHGKNSKRYPCKCASVTCIYWCMQRSPVESKILEMSEKARGEWKNGDACSFDNTLE